MTSFSAHGNHSAGLRWLSWPSLWRGGLLTLAIVFVLSTQLLFQLGFTKAGRSRPFFWDGWTISPTSLS